MNFWAPLPSKDDRQLFVIGEERRSELERYDLKSGQFVPFLHGISAAAPSFSKDGEWIAYVVYPEGTLWRSKVDGTERLQLSYAPMQADVPCWSPDGKQIAFSAKVAGRPWKIYVVSAEGGSLQGLMPGERNESAPDWSPDGGVLAFGPLPVEGVSGAGGIRLLDLRTHQVSTLPGSEEVQSPRWSPDGRSLAAVSGGSLKLVLFDFTSKKWTALFERNAYDPNWSRDGKYIYFTVSFVSEPAIVRIRLSDKKIERLATLKGFRQVGGSFVVRLTLAPDDSPVLPREVGSQEIYALDWQHP